MARCDGRRDPMPRKEASAFGIIETAPDGRGIKAFLEKPADPPGIPGSPDESYVSMGNYVFSTDALIETLKIDAGDEGSVHDMGGNIIPMMTEQGMAQVYDFADNDVPGATDRDRGYWRDVGTIDAYHDAHMDLVNVHPVFNLYNRQWPILGHLPPLPPAKFVLSGNLTSRWWARVRSSRAPMCVIRFLATTSTLMRERSLRGPLLTLELESVAELSFGAR